MQCIHLEKGQSVPIRDICEDSPESVRVGFNWGAIHKKQLLGLIKTDRPVNLDASVALFGENGKLYDMVYYKRLHSDDHSIVHSGDDKTGDMGKDDGADNEMIEVKLQMISESIHTIAIFLTSNVDFATVPYIKIRFYSPAKDGGDNVYAEYNISTDQSFKGKLSMIFGLMQRDEIDWVFHSIGEPLEANNINDAIDEIQARYLATQD